MGVMQGPVLVYRFHPCNLMKSVNKSRNLIYDNLDHLVAPTCLPKAASRPSNWPPSEKIPNWIVMWAIPCCVWRITAGMIIAFADRKLPAGFRK
jgi:hypothetical protein